MTTPNERLKIARARFFASAGEAADAMNIPRGTYAGHENGHRGFPASRAPQYARKFKVSEEWLLYGKGGQAETLPSDDDLEAMIAIALDELPIPVGLGDYSRAVASSLRDQLERYQASGGSKGISDVANAPDKGAPPPEPTTPPAGA